MDQKEITNNKIIAYCGLYCTNCPRLKKGKCPGCMLNNKAKWCKIRFCCIENSYTSCAECKKFDHVRHCRYYGNFFSNLIEFITRTERSRCINCLKQEGIDSYILKMEKSGKMSMAKHRSK